MRVLGAHVPFLRAIGRARRVRHQHWQHEYVLHPLGSKRPLDPPPATSMIEVLPLSMPQAKDLNLGCVVPFSLLLWDVLNVIVFFFCAKVLSEVTHARRCSQ